MSFLSLLLAVTTLAQDSSANPPPTPSARKQLRAAVVSIAPRAIAVPQLEGAATAMVMAESQIQAIAEHAPIMAAQTPMIALHAPVIAMSTEQLEAAAMGIALANAPSIEFWDQDDAQNAQDPGDSLYRAARSALNRNNYTRAAELFRSVRERHPRSEYVANTYYWEAFALYRTGSDDALRTARSALKLQAERYPKATTRRDAQSLMRRIQGTLARRGDAEAAEEISVEVESIAPVTPETPKARAPRPPRPPRPSRHYSASCNDDDDLRIEALNAMLQMDADRAVPILKTVLARRDTGSTCLRRKAVFLVSQKRSAETAQILLNSARSDPDQEVREQAVFWLSQVPGDETVTALDSILQGSDDVEVQDKAVFALSQHRSPRAAAILCTYSGRRDRPADLREKSIFWLGQRRSADNQQCLRDLYKNLENDDLKEKVIFSLSQMGGADNYRWLMDIALNQRENIELRKKALFWAGQGRSVELADLVRLYDSMNDREMKEQLIFVYSQRREDAALEKLFQIGKNDPDRELRKKAIFWVGQSRSPKAAQYLQELINQ